MTLKSFKITYWQDGARLEVHIRCTSRESLLKMCKKRWLKYKIEEIKDEH